MRSRSMIGRMLRGVARAATLLTSVVLVIGVALYLFVTNGIDNTMLGEQAEAAIRNLSGLDVEASVGSATISIDRSQFLAVSVPDVRLRTKEGKAPLLEAGTIDFGLRTLPLLSGEVQLGSARISNARLFTQALETGEASDWSAAIKNTDGLIDPDLVAPVLFDAVHRLYDALGVGSTRSVELDNVEVVLGPDAAVDGLVIDSAALAQTSDAELTFSADLVVDNRTVTIRGSAVRDPQSKRVTALKLDTTASGPKPDTGSEPPTNVSNDDAKEPVGDVLGAVQLSLTGVEGEAHSPSRLTLEGSIGRSTFAIDSQDYLEGEIDLSASVTTGENKARIEKLAIRQGRSNYVLYGPVGPRPVSAGQPAAYRFELASDRSTSAPEGSTEPALDFSLALAGSYDPAAKKLDLPSLKAQTQSGGLEARIAVAFVDGKPPGVDLAVTVPKLSTSDMKQLWPFIAGSSARRWAMNNLFGGHVANGSVRYSVPPGRIGNGVPLSGDEVSGHIEVSDVRFDITGEVPPMRDAAGAVDFRGNDVDVKLASGAVYLPNDRSVSATNGVFTIRDAYKDVVVGQLEIDVSGAADAVAELASYEPLDALRSTGMTHDEFSGEMWGHVSTQIPLVGDVDPRSLVWQVSLDYTDLALARPIEDQLVTQAVGNITIDPDKAVIRAKARLNGAPAEIAMVEPLRKNGARASRDISMTLDDKAREAIAPGIGDFVSGPMKVSFSKDADGAQRIEADLTDAVIDFSWVGWSKGKGVAADVEFSLVRSGSTTRLDNFKLSGKSFSINGAITLGNGSLASAKFGLVQLNRGDKASVSINRAGKGFDISVTGASIDARSLIKLLKDDKTGDGDRADARPISVTAKVDRVLGFNDESLSDVTLKYSGRGPTVGAADFSAVTASGGAVSMQDGTRDGARSLEMKSADAGAVLRFLDIYEHMVGGTIGFALSGAAGGQLTGQVDAANFQIVEEKKLRSLVSSAPAGDGQSLNEAVKREIDTSRVSFERGFANIVKSDGSVVLKNGVLRGPAIGSTFQGTLYNKAGNMDMTGTFMPAYGINRIFGELPLVGAILGNGRDRGLIGVTFKLTGDADKPNLQINPLSVIAPGIFRSIFEFR